MSPDRLGKPGLFLVTDIRKVTMLAAMLVTAALAPGVAPLQVTPCERTPLAVVVNLDNEKNDDTIAHTRAAVISGQPRVLHIARLLASLHRSQSLRGIRTRDGFDRDEYPPAASSEGGIGANVDYVESSDNRSAGSRMARQLGPYCDGQAFILEPGTP